MDIEKSIQQKAEKILEIVPRTMADGLGVEFLKMAKDCVKASMPVTDPTVQPMRILHGGASVALAETLMSIGAWLNLDAEDETAVGVEINANHIRPVNEGEIVIAEATPIRRGRKIQVWETKIRTEQGKLVSVSRCTLAIVKHRKEA